MLRVTASTAGQTKRYYNESLTKEGYYSEGGEIAGHWGGKGAARLGLSGRVEKEAFIALCDNTNPATGEKLTPRTKENRRVSYDFNFNVPKSVSLAYEYHQDERIFGAFVDCVRETMGDLEQEIATRVRKGGQDRDRPTGAMLWAEFFHFWARPEGGVPDPHLHGHVVAFNATPDPVEGCWKAAQMGGVLENINFYQASFHTRFARRLRELGYETIAQGISFELAGVSRSLIEKFSRRGAAIEARAKELGITRAEEKDKLAALTREKKVQDLSKSELHEFWWSQLTPEEKNELEGLGKGLGREREMEPIAQSKEALGKSRRALALEPCSAKPMDSTPTVTRHDLEAVDFALKHVFYTASVVTEQQLLTEALRWGCGLVSVAGVRAALREFPVIRLKKNGRQYLTTAEVVMEEHRIVERCQRGIGKFAALNPGWKIQDSRLNDQQRAAVAHVLTAHEFVTGIVGKAGVGKTTALLEAARAIEAAGQKVMAFAPTAISSRGTLRESGFPQAETVDKLLVNEALQARSRGAVWFVDEGGLMSGRLAERLLGLAERLEARVVVVGDTGQHHSVERGDAFRLLQELGGMPVVTIDQIQRQRGRYKAAVELIAQGRHPAAFEVLEQMGAIFEIADQEERYRAMAADYVAAVKADKSALLVAPTHLECDLVTEQVRRALHANGTLGEGRAWSILRNLSWSPAHKTDGRLYEPGMVVKVTGHLQGFALGEPLEVVAGQKEEVLVRRENGECRSLPLAQAEKFNVYERDAIEVCRGDRLRVTVNSRSADGHPLHNGTLYSVKGFARDGGIILNNGWELAPDFGHLAYGYANTSHSAQSRSIDRILVAQSGLISSGATNANQFYTAVSRGKEFVHIYTDDMEGLRENVARVQKRELASELIAEMVREEERATAEVGRGLEPKAELAGAIEPGRAAEVKPELGLEAAPEPTTSRELGETTGEPETPLQTLIEEIVSAVAERETEMVPEKVHECEQTRATVPQIAREPEREVVLEM